MELLLCENETLNAKYVLLHKEYQILKAVEVANEKLQLQLENEKTENKTSC